MLLSKLSGKQIVKTKHWCILVLAPLWYLYGMTKVVSNNSIKKSTEFIPQLALSANNVQIKSTF